MLPNPHQSPPWELFPDILPDTPLESRSPEWINYCEEWQAWYLHLAPDVRSEYEQRQPEPEGWRGFYGFVSGR